MKTFLVSLVIIGILICVSECSGVRITFPGCDRQGWRCVKVENSPIRYRIEYVCSSVPNNDVSLALWNFNAPAEIKYLSIMNCSSVEIDLTCTGVGRIIESLFIKSVGILNFTNLLYKDVAQFPEKVIFEEIANMPLIPEKTFKQMKNVPASAYRCAINLQPTNTITFRNVNIGTIAQNAFYNLTDVKSFTWTNVTVRKMEPLAVQVTMDKSGSFNVSGSVFQQLDYKALEIRSPSVWFGRTRFEELPRNGIDVISFQFNFVNNFVERVQSFAFIILSQDVNISDNNFRYLETSALQGIGPGLLENAYMSFGNLLFSYYFIHNNISHSNIGGLNPDWAGYKNVHSNILVKYNYLRCSCKELGWITLRDGLGDNFSHMMRFNSKFLDWLNQNWCLNTPCLLPVTVMTAMSIKFGQCGSDPDLALFCRNYNSSSFETLGLGAVAKTVLASWKPDFSKQQQPPSVKPDKDLENILELVLTTENILPDKELEKNKSNYFDYPSQDNLLIEPFSQDDPKSNNSHIFFIDTNSTVIKPNGEILNGTDSVTKIITLIGNTTEDGTIYQEAQKNLLKESYDQWKAARRKRMVYFQLYGKMMSLE